MYQVTWSTQAVTDLTGGLGAAPKVRSPQVRKHLFAVARTALLRHFPRFGGVAGEHLWRRGVLEEEETHLQLTRPGRGVLDGEGGEAAYQYVLVFQPMTPARKDRFMILGVMTEGEAAAAYGTATAQW